MHSLQNFFGHGVWIAAKNPCWHSLAAFHNHPAARRYVRSTWNWLLKTQKTSAVAHFYLLKLSVFKKLRLGDLRARFWRPRGSILEGPGSILCFGRLKPCLKAFLGGEHFATDLSCIFELFAGEKWSRSCRATGRLPRMPVLPCPASDGRGAHGVGWPAVSPLTGLQ